MNKSDELLYLGRIISLLARHQQLTLGEIKNKTKHFLRKKHQTDSSLFNTLELFCTQGLLERTVYRSRIYYKLGHLSQEQKPAPISKRDLLEAGVQDQSEMIKQMIENAKKYKGKEAPPNNVEGFK